MLSFLDEAYWFAPFLSAILVTSVEESPCDIIYLSLSFNDISKVQLLLCFDFILNKNIRYPVAGSLAGLPVLWFFISGTSSRPSLLLLSWCSASRRSRISSMSRLIWSASPCFVFVGRFLGSADPHQPILSKNPCPVMAELRQ